MFVVRNIFKCKPGMSKALIQKMKAANDIMKSAGAMSDYRVLVDEVADFWTVVLEIEVDDMAGFARGMQEYGSRTDVQDAMAGYMDLVNSGYREVFRIA